LNLAPAPRENNGPCLAYQSRANYCNFHKFLESAALDQSLGMSIDNQCLSAYIASRAAGGEQSHISNVARRYHAPKRCLLLILIGNRLYWLAQGFCLGCNHCTYAWALHCARQDCIDTNTELA